jgi:dTDP-4-dehydrorhamnose reductase
MNILVTGSNGQLGTHMRLLAPRSKHTWLMTHVAELDITSKEAVSTFVNQHNIQLIVNCAGYTNVDRAESDEATALRVNAEAVANLAEAMHHVDGTLIHVSTDYVFGGNRNNTPCTEEEPVNPTGAYGRTKLAGEEAVLASCKKSMIIRTAWLYSTFGNNFVKTMIRLGNEKPELGVIFDQIGTPTYARDLAVAIFAAINKGVVPGVYHFSNEGVISWYDFTKAIHRIAGIKDCKVRPLHTAEYPTPAARPHYSVLDKTKIKQTYGIEIPYWETSLAECIGSLLGTD